MHALKKLQFFHVVLHINIYIIIIIINTYKYTHTSTHMIIIKCN